LSVAVSTDGIRTPVPRAPYARLAAFVLRAEGVRAALLSVTFVSARAIAQLNATHLGHAGPTDVISFGLRPEKGGAPAVVGDVYLCPSVARSNAQRFGTTTRRELERLVVHGTLHVLGWDHDEGAGRERSKMWSRQEALLRSWNRSESRA